MDWNTIKTNWHRVGPLASARWPSIDPTYAQDIAGEQKKLEAHLVRYDGMTAQEAKKQVEEWAQNIESSPAESDNPYAPKPKPQPPAPPKTKE